MKKRIHEFFLRAKERYETDPDFCKVNYDAFVELASLCSEYHIPKKNHVKLITNLARLATKYAKIRMEGIWKTSTAFSQT